MSIPGNINQLLIGAAASGGGDVVGPIKSVRFNSPDSQYLNRTFGTATSLTTFTVSFWVKRVDFDQAVYLLTAGTGTNGYITLDAGQIRFYSSQGDLKTGTDRLFRDASSWYHIVMVADTSNASSDERTRMYINGVQLTNANGDFVNYTQPNLNDVLGDWNTANTHYINRLTSGSYGNFYMTDHYFIDGQALQASDFGEFDSNGIWKPKLYEGTYGNNGYHLFDFANVTDVGSDSSGNGNNWTANNIGSSVGTQPTAPASGAVYSNNYFGYYLNGNPPLFLVYDPSGTSRADSITHGASTGTTWVVDDVLQWAIDWSAGKVWLGRNNTWYESGDPAGGTNPGMSSFDTSYNYYLALGYDSPDFELKVPSSPTYTPPSGFTYWGGATISTWLNSGTDQGGVVDVFKTPIPKSGKTYIEAQIKGGLTTYATLGLANFGETTTTDDTFRDVCVNHNHEDTGVGGEVSSNYATWNPLTLRLSGSTASLAKGNLHFKTTNSGYAVVVATTPMGPGGKYYCELSFEGTKASATNYAWFGIAPSKSIPAYTSGSNDVDLQRSLNALSMSASKTNSRASQGTGSGQNEVDFNASLGYDENDVIGIGVNLDDDILTFYKNGVSFGTFPYTPESGETYCFFCVDWANGADIDNYILNAGQQTFAYPAPSGFKALCTSSIPDSTITDGSKHFDSALYDGNSSTQNITGLEFEPSFVYLKSRSAATYAILHDAVRTADKALYMGASSTGTSAEVTLTDSLTSFNSDGFSLGDRSIINYTGRTYVGWAWNAGTSTVTNNDGSQTSQVRANTTAGFSIATFDTPNPSAQFTYGHGLGVAPEVVIHKNRDSGGNWYTYHESLGQKYINWNDNGQEATSEFTVAPTSTVFTYPSSLIVGPGEGMVAYSFASVAGFSFIGYYTGDGSDDGPFINCGFRPAWCMTKSMSAGGDWQIWDSKREPFNYNANTIATNTTAAESDTSGYKIDFVSNGIKFRMYGSSSNASGVTYLYLIFAENPFKLNGGIAV